MSHAWMPFYVADYLADTTHLSTMEHGAYLLLIMHYWQHGELPSNARALSRICRTTEDEWLEIAQTMSDLFAQPGWRHKRIDRELEKADFKHSRRVDAGKAGGKAKANGLANAKQTPSIASSIASSNALASSSQPQPEKIATQSSARGEYDILESQLREAAGLVDDPSPGLLVLRPIYDLTEAGYDLQRDILPFLRESKARGKRASTWGYYAKGIESRKAQAAPVKPLAKVVAAVEWVSDVDARWRVLAERYHKEHGKAPPKTAGTGGMGRHFPKDWVDDCLEIPDELRRTA